MVWQLKLDDIHSIHFFPTILSNSVLFLIGCFRLRHYTIMPPKLETISRVRVEMLSRCEGFEGRMEFVPAFY